MLRRDLHGLGRHDRVGDDQLLELGIGDARHGPAREHAMGDVGVDLLGALGEQRIGCIHQRAARVDDVVDQDAGAALDRSR